MHHWLFPTLQWLENRSRLLHSVSMYKAWLGKGVIIHSALICKAWQGFSYKVLKLLYKQHPRLYRQHIYSHDYAPPQLLKALCNTWTLNQVHVQFMQIRIWQECVQKKAISSLIYDFENEQSLLKVPQKCNYYKYLKHTGHDHCANLKDLT